MPSRRDFFKQAAALSGSASFTTALLAAVQKASGIDPATGSTYLDAEHVVILMQENRSFDHCFGALRGVRGFNDPRAVTLPDQNPVWLQTNSAGETYAPFRLNIKDTKATWLGSLPHSWRDQTDARNHGDHDKWLDAKPTNHPGCAGMPLTLGYYTREDLPFYYALADAFTVCDQNFCSSLTGTTPNRLFLWTGTIRDKQSASSPAKVRNSDVTEYAQAHWTTFPERLEDAGVSWKIYQNELSLPTGFDNEEDAWLANFTDNPIEWFIQYNAEFSEMHRDYIAQQSISLPGEIAALKPTTPAEARALRSKQALLKKITADGPRWTAENFEKLSPQEKSLHSKAFTTNKGDPDYRKLTTLKYQDGEYTRALRVPKGDVLHQFREDVKQGSLPAVSWIVAPERFSDHPGAPWYGAWYVAEVLNILTKNPEVWKKTIFVLTYDENDGYFDHVPPFVAPDPEVPATGRTTPGIDAGVEYHSLAQDRAKYSEKEARGGPVGLGYRVPMVIASPWSRGGTVCSQVFDHTSVLQLLEKVLSRKTGKQIQETNISKWRRTVCGDLTSAFRPFHGEQESPLTFPQKDAVIEGIHKAQFKGLPTGFRKLSKQEAYGHLLKQESGVRPSMPLPYKLYAEGSLTADRKALEITMKAGEKAGSGFHVYTPGKSGTRAYAVEAGASLADLWTLDGNYHVHVHGPNGFLRGFSGSTSDPLLDVRCEYVGGDVEVQIRNKDRSRDYNIQITDHSYKTGNHSLSVARGKAKSIPLNLKRSFHWYDFSVRVVGAAEFERRYAGRVETGKMGFSDPAMGRVSI